MNDTACDTGTITKIENNNLYIKKQENSSCGSCAMKALCGQADTAVIVIPHPPNTEHRKPYTDFRLGDTVDIYISTKSRIISLLWVFFMPIVLLFTLYAIFSRVTALSGHWTAALTFMICIPLWLIILRVINKSTQKKHIVQIKKTTPSIEGK